MTQEIDTTGTPGAVAQPTYMHRTSKVYAIYETEMDTISTLNSVCTAAFAAAGSFASFSVGLFVSDAISPAMTADGKAIVSLGVPSGFVIALVCIAIGIATWIKKGGTLTAIKSESRAVTRQEVEAPDSATP
jgi:hypothetical protein